MRRSHHYFPAATSSRNSRRRCPSSGQFFQEGGTTANFRPGGSLGLWIQEGFRRLHLASLFVWAGSEESSESGTQPTQPESVGTPDPRQSWKAMPTQLCANLTWAKGSHVLSVGRRIQHVRPGCGLAAIKRLLILGVDEGKGAYALGPVGAGV